MRPLFLAALVSLALVAAGCAGDLGARVGSDYANVNFSGASDYNGRSTQLVNGVKLSREGARSTVTATDPWSTPANTDLAVTRALTLVDAASPEPGTGSGETTPVDLAASSRASLTYVEPGATPKAWRAVAGTITISYFGGGGPSATFRDLRLEPDPSVVPNAARGVLRLTGFLNPNAPQ